MKLTYLRVFEAVVYGWLCVLCAWLAVTLVVADHIVFAVIVAVQAVLAGFVSVVYGYYAKACFRRVQR